MSNRKKRRPKPRKRRRDEPSMITVSSGCADPTTCAVCADLATKGDVLAMTRDGKTIRIDPATLKTIEVTVRGDVTTWPTLDTKPQTVELPKHCTLEGLLTYLNYRDPGFSKLEVVVGSIGGNPRNLTQVLQDGDDITITRSLGPEPFPLE